MQIGVQQDRQYGKSDLYGSVWRTYDIVPGSSMA